MKKVLGLDLGTNSIGWALVENNQEAEAGKIIDCGSRIIPMSQDVLGKFDSGVSLSQTAERTGYRATRRSYQRDNLRRDRLHRVLQILGFLPEHYSRNIDFENKLGQFKTETKLNYRYSPEGKYQFIFENSFLEMCQDLRSKGYNGKNIPKDWTIYYLRCKALTQRITKEELAWIILNFNQKRGYYQLRGDEVDTDINKEFVQLKVNSIKDTGSEVKGNKLYEVQFENGWLYDKLITKTENWHGQVKEFIVSTKTLKSGELKRTFKAVDSKQDWPAIKAKTENDIEGSGLYVGQYIYDHIIHHAAAKIRGKLIKTIERKFYKAELKAILDSQATYHAELKDKSTLNKCIDHLYQHNIAHRNNIKDKDFTYLIVEDIIFYQRPLKSKKSTIGGCKYEYREYLDTSQKPSKKIKSPLKAIPKSHPLYQEFRLWQFITNLHIIDINKDVSTKDSKQAQITSQILATEEDYTQLFDFLNQRKEIAEKDLLKYFVKAGKISKEDLDLYQWNYVRDKKYPCNPTRAAMLTRLKKVTSIDALEFLDTKKEVGLWHIIYSVKDKTEFVKALQTYSTKHNISADFVKAFAKIKPYTNDYATLSMRAINKLIPLMRMGKYWNADDIDSMTMTRIQKIVTGEYDEKIRDRVRDKAIHLNHLQQFRGLPLWLASYIVYDKHAEGQNIAKWNSPADIDLYLKEFKQHSLRNPIVEQLVTETLRTVRDIWTYHGNGKPGFFDRIHLELGREMKNSADKRKRISAKVSENQKTNDRIYQLLEELVADHAIQGNIRPYSPSHQEIMKIYEEGIAQNPNTRYDRVSEDEIDKIRRNIRPSRKDIQRYKLWLEQGYVSPYTGKVIPLSQLFTTEYEIEHIIPQSRYFDNSLSNKIICEASVNGDKGSKTAYEYLSLRGGEQVDGHTLLELQDYEEHVNKYFAKNRSKLRNLLSMDIPEGFINRQLNDSRYISKFLKGLLSNIVRKEGEQEYTSKNLQPFSGAITAKLRHDWGLNDKWNEIISPRFKRLNELTNSSDYGYYDQKINAFRIQVPDDQRNSFSSKRIDHRHHALDALVIACTSKEHVNYLNSLESERANYSLRAKLLVKNDQGQFTKHFKLPWKSFPIDVKNAIENIIVSFKQNNRIINKTNNKTWQWVLGPDGNMIKRKVNQTKGDNWAIRKPLHKETVASKVNHIDTPKGKIATANRVPLKELKNEKHIDKITDKHIQKLLRKHLEYYKNEKGKADFEAAFNEAGVDRLNHNIVQLNDGKPHMPIKKVKQYEVGTKYQVGISGNNSSKYVEAAKGTNLFFAIYWDNKKGKRNFESVPLIEVVAHQKQVAHLPKKERLAIQPNPDKGDFLFSLSPNDLVYVPTPEEQEQDFNPIGIPLNSDQIKRIYKMVSCTGSECHFTSQIISKEITKNENGTNSKNERILPELLTETILDKKNKGVMIKSVCWKINVSRIGKITHAIKGE